eukprot:732218-Pyramimonas_sp.AAC.1
MAGGTSRLFRKASRSLDAFPRSNQQRYPVMSRHAMMAFFQFVLYAVGGLPLELHGTLEDLNELVDIAPEVGVDRGALNPSKQ